MLDYLNAFFKQRGAVGIIFVSLILKSFNVWFFVSLFDLFDFLVGDPFIKKLLKKRLLIFIFGVVLFLRK